MAQVVLDRPITETEWDALVDPDGGRFEVLDGRLVMTPSQTAGHSRHGEDLAHLLRRALKRAGLDLPVTLDVEWRTIAADVVVQAPRGDVVVGSSLDPRRDIHDALPVLVVEIWSARTPQAERNERRSYWATRGLTHYWELHLADQSEDIRIDVHDLTRRETVLASATGHDEVSVAEPFPITLCPSDIHGWAERQADQAEQRIEQERAAKEWEKARADAAEERLAQIEHGTS